MAAPSGIVWGSVVTGSKSTRKGRIGIYTSLSNTSDTQVKVNVEVWFWSMYSVDDVNNTFSYNGTTIGAKTIDHRVDSGSGWSESNQTRLHSTSHAYTKTTSSSTKTYSAKFTGLETLGVNSTLSVSTSVTIPALTTYTISYNANGGSGAPAKQTKYLDKSITLSGTKPTRSGYKFSKWNTKSDGSGTNYDSGATYSSNASVTLYAIWTADTYTISYNANGGSGAPGNQTKTHDKSITLSSTKPTRTNYAFKGWAVSGGDGSVSYSPGSTYNTNANLSLYAVWELTYSIPKLYDLAVSRCTSDGVIADNGTSMAIYFVWSTELTVSSITVSWKDVQDNGSSTTISASGTSGTVDNVIGLNAFDIEKTYTVTVTVSDDNGTSVPATATLPGAKFIIDILNAGQGIAFGKSAELPDTVDFGWEAKFNKPIYGKVVGMDKLPRLPEGTDINAIVETGCYGIPSNDFAKTMTNLPCIYGGRLEVYSSSGVYTDHNGWLYIRQRFVPMSLDYGVWERDIVRNGEEEWTYYTWKLTSSANMVLFDGNTNDSVTLAADIKYFEYLEIYYRDNNGFVGGYTKLHAPYDNPIHLSVIEPAAGTTTYIRRTKYTLSGTSLTPDTSLGSYVLISGSTVSHTNDGVNRIKITRVVGYHA